MRVHHKFKFSNSLETLETNIAEIIECRGGVLIRTFQSQIRARFGGQLEDSGEVYLNGWNQISDIVLLNNNPYFFFPNLKKEKIEVGSPILVKLDLIRRQRISAMHTAIHLLCSLTGIEMKVGHAGIFKSRVDFLGDADEFNSRIDRIRAQFSECIHANLSVDAIYMSDPEALCLGEMQEIKDEKHHQALRVINIDGVDIRACNGTHVDRTGLLQGVGFGLAEKVGPKKFKVNLFLSCETPSDRG